MGVYTILYTTCKPVLEGTARNDEDKKIKSFRVLHSIFGLLRTCKECPLASLAGVEPATCRLGGGCSILLSYRDLWGA